MPTFAYEARNEEGELTAGTITARSIEHAGQILSQQHLFVVRMGSEDACAKHAPLKGSATGAQIAWVFSQLSVMVETGIRLTEALDCLARQSAHPRLAALLRQISNTVQEGRPLSEAMAMHPRSFPSSLTALIRSSEMSGTMSSVLRRCASHLMNDQRVKHHVRNATIYPLFMLGMSIAISIFLLTTIIPRFAGIFEARNAVLPAPTRLLMALSDSLMGHWYLWAGGGAVVLAAAGIAARTSAFRLQRDHLVLILPVISGICRPLYQCRAFRTLSVLLDSGVTLSDAVAVVQDVVPNARFQNLWQRVEESMRRGESMAEPLMNSSLIPEQVAMMIGTGERSARLGSVFAQLADFTEDEYHQRVKTATQFIEPLMILIVGSIIGLVAGALILPLFQSSHIVAG